jgi:hypothetical protein
MEPYQNINLTQVPNKVDDLLRDPGLNFVQKKADLQIALKNL